MTLFVHERNIFLTDSEQHIWGCGTNQSLFTTPVTSLNAMKVFYVQAPRVSMWLAENGIDKTVPSICMCRYKAIAPLVSKSIAKNEQLSNLNTESVGTCISSLAFVIFIYTQLDWQYKIQYFFVRFTRWNWFMSYSLADYSWLQRLKINCNNNDNSHTAHKCLLLNEEN